MFRNNKKSFFSVLINISIALAIYVISPIYLIRFCRIRSSKLGYLAFQPYVYLFNLNNEKQPRTKDYFYTDGGTSNSQLLKIWKRILSFNDALGPIHKALNTLSKSDKFTINTDINPELNYFSEEIDAVNFNYKQIKEGQSELENMGLSLNHEYICFINREPSHFKNASNLDIKENEYRNFSLEDMLPAVQELTKHGLHGVRLGEASNELITENNKIIDYASKYRSEFMDLFLISRAKFLLCPNSGPYVVSTLFKRPVGFVNLSPFLGTNGYYQQDSIFIPKKYWLLQENRLMTLSEIFERKVYSLMTLKEYETMGIKLISNTSEEIKLLALEMLNRLNNEWETTSLDEEIYSRYLDILSRYVSDCCRIPRISLSFLKLNQEFLN